MSRTGKIARLAPAIRDQLNRRLADNEAGPDLLAWLNALPEVKALLAADFDAVPISPANLTHWKAGGFRDWLTRQDALQLARDLEDKQALGDEALAGPFPGKLARWLAIHYAAAAVRGFAAEDLDPETHWRRLRELCADVTRLQRGEHQARRLDLERDRLELDISNAEWERKQDLQAAKLRVLSLQRLAAAAESAASEQSAATPTETAPVPALEPETPTHPPPGHANHVEISNLKSRLPAPSTPAPPGTGSLAG